jgi:hypothetical protein
MGKIILGLLSFLICAQSFAVSHVNSYSYASVNVTTSAYTVLWSSIPVSTSKIEVCDSSGKLLKIATGATGSEVDVFTVFVSGCVIIPIYLTIGTKLSIKAIDANATSGYNLMSLL